MTEKCMFDRDIGVFDKPSPWVRPDRPWLRGKQEYKIPTTINYPELEGAHCLLTNSANEFPQNLAFYMIPQEEKFTWAFPSTICQFRYQENGARLLYQGYCV